MRYSDQPDYLQIDDRGRVTVIGSGLRRKLSRASGHYVLLSAEGPLVHWRRVDDLPHAEGFSEPIILQGDIEAFGSTVEVINFVHSARQSGQLIFVTGDLQRSLFFSKGEVKSAASNRIEDRLGEVLFRYGAISRHRLDSGLEASRRLNQPLGTLLVEQGALSTGDLKVFVQRQIEEIFYSILMAKSGDFYLTRASVQDLAGEMTLSAQSMLMEGLRRIDELTYFKQQIPHSHSRVVRCAAATSTDGLDVRGQGILKVLDQPRSIDALTRSCHLSEFDTMKVVFGLLQGGFVEVVEEPDESVDHDGRTEGELSRMVDTFNSVFQRIFAAISRHGRQDSLEQGLGTFLQFYGFVELFQNVSFDGRGRLDKQQLLSNLERNPIENRGSFLSQALNELLFFEMFAAREWLDREEQQELQTIINQLFIEIG